MGFLAAGNRDLGYGSVWRCPRLHPLLVILTSTPYLHVRQRRGETYHDARLHDGSCVYMCLLKVHGECDVMRSIHGGKPLATTQSCFVFFFPRPLILPLSIALLEPLLSQKVKALS